MNAPTDSAPSDPIKLQQALMLERAKSRTLTEVNRVLLTSLEQLLELARHAKLMKPEQLQATQEAIDLTTHIQSLWPTDENPN